MYKACIFDLDGTLTDTLESLTFSVNATLKELGLRQITDRQCKAFVGNGARHLIERSLEAAGDDHLQNMEEAMQIYQRIFGAHCTYRVEPYEGILELLYSLKQREIKMAVLSNKPHLQTKDVVKTFFGEAIFDYANGQQEGVPRKPDPAGVFSLLKELGITVEECIYIGDSEVDMKTGKAAGVLTVGVTWGFRDRDVLAEYGADHIIDRPEELITILEDEGVN